MLTKVLAIYSSVLTTGLAALALSGSAAAKPQSFDEIDVRRINVREPDGTLRLVISNRARLPGVIERGQEHAKVDRPQAGMLFYNDEGTENGDLIFGGQRNARGYTTLPTRILLQVTAAGDSSLSFLDSEGQVVNQIGATPPKP